MHYVLINAIVIVYVVVGIVAGTHAARDIFKYGDEDYCFAGYSFLLFFFLWPVFVVVLGPCWLIGRFIKFVFNKIKGLKMRYLGFCSILDSSN